MKDIWQIKSGNVLDIKCDALICSANPQLNLSGGVGGQLLQHYGTGIQQELRQYLKQHEKTYLREGQTVCTFPQNTPYKIIIHAVAINIFYESTIETVTKVVDSSLKTIQQHNLKTVALCSLATGYGNLKILDFAQAIYPLLSQDYSPLTKIMVCLKNKDDADTIKDYFEQKEIFMDK